MGSRKIRQYQQLNLPNLDKTYVLHSEVIQISIFSKQFSNGINMFKQK